MSLEPPVSGAEKKKPHTAGVCWGIPLCLSRDRTKHKETLYRPHAYEVRILDCSTARDPHLLTALQVYHIILLCTS
jgi:hypothetical protein